MASSPNNLTASDDFQSYHNGSAEKCIESTEPHAPKGPLNLAVPESEPYPEGGRAAYLSLFGCFCAWLCAYGLMNTIGTFQAYLGTHQLAGYSEADIGWIFGLYLFMAYCCGVQTGPIFDAIGPRWLTVVGSVSLVLAMFLLELCSRYYHFILVFSIIGGVGTSLLSTVAIGTIGHWFNARRGYATGLASCAGSLGGVFFNLMLSSLFTSAGFAWATRALGFLFLFLLVIANLLIRSRLPGKSISRRNLLPDPWIFKDKTFAIMTAALFLIEWGLFCGLSYLTSFALSAGIRPTLAYQLLSILNAGSFFGRWAPGLLADRIGRFNTMILMISLCLISMFTLWLPIAVSPSSPAMESLIIIFALLFGFASGSNITLGPVCAGQLCRTEDYGKYFATCFTGIGIGTLVGIPIAGEILKREGGTYVGLVTFGGTSYAVGLVLFVSARIRVVGWGWGRESIF